MIVEKSLGVVIPKFDRIAAAICIYLWFTMQSIATNIEVLVITFKFLWLILSVLYSWHPGIAIQDGATSYNSDVQLEWSYGGIVQWYHSIY